jgi:hypothetical protein
MRLHLKNAVCFGWEKGTRTIVLPYRVEYKYNALAHVYIENDGRVLFGYR